MSRVFHFILAVPFLVGAAGGAGANDFLPFSCNYNVPDPNAYVPQPVGGVVSIFTGAIPMSGVNLEDLAPPPRFNMCDTVLAPHIDKAMEPCLEVSVRADPMFTGGMTMPEVTKGRCPEPAPRTRRGNRLNWFARPPAGTSTSSAAPSSTTSTTSTTSTSATNTAPPAEAKNIECMADQSSKQRQLAEKKRLDLIQAEQKMREAQEVYKAAVIAYESADALATSLETFTGISARDLAESKKMLAALEKTRNLNLDNLSLTKADKFLQELKKIDKARKAQRKTAMDKGVKTAEKQAAACLKADRKTSEKNLPAFLKNSFLLAVTSRNYCLVEIRTRRGTRLSHSPCNGKDAAQTFNVKRSGTGFQIVNAKHNLCVQPAGANSALLATGTCNNGAAQRWTFDAIGFGRFSLKSAASKKCLTLIGDGKKIRRFEQRSCTKLRLAQDLEIVKLR